MSWEFLGQVGSWIKSIGLAGAWVNFYLSLGWSIFWGIVIIVLKIK